MPFNSTKKVDMPLNFKRGYEKVFIVLWNVLISHLILNLCGKNEDL